MQTLTRQTEYYEDGAVRRVLHTLGGALHGVELGWSYRGELVEFSEWDEGLRHGLSVAWSDRGTLLSVEKFEFGIPSGEARYYFQGEPEPRVYDFGRLPNAIVGMAAEGCGTDEIGTRLVRQVEAVIDHEPTVRWFVDKVEPGKLERFLRRKLSRGTDASENL